MREQSAFAALGAAQRKLIDNELRDFKLGGAELADAQKERFRAVQEELGDLATQFEEHLLDATNAWAHYCDDVEELAGVPAEVVAEARAAAEAEGKAGYKLTLRMPCYSPVMQYAERRELRRLLHQAYATRGSDLGANPEWNNGPVIARILELRREVAQLLGYRNFAQVSLVPKMAQDPEEVIAFLRDLARRAKPFAERDYAELSAFARSDLRLPDMAPWDVAFVVERLKAKRYAFNEQEVRQYFAEDQVLAGLFRVVETIYGVRIRDAKAPVWHPTVRFFAIHDRQGAFIGEFYFDLYAREGKQGGAWTRVIWASRCSTAW